MKTSVDLILRTSKQYEQDSSHKVDIIPPDEVCVIYLGGNETNDTKAANGNAKIVDEQVIKRMGVKVPVYAVSYNYNGNTHAGKESERSILFNKHGKNMFVNPTASQSVIVTEKNYRNIFNRQILPRIATKFGTMRSVPAIRDQMRKLFLIADGNISKITLLLEDKIRDVASKMECSEPDTQEIITCLYESLEQKNTFSDDYINELFCRTILPRITDDKGNRLDTQTAMRRIRKINIVAHCHGGFVALELENRTAQMMRALGYTPNEITNILSQLLVVAHAPACPVGKTKSRFISFFSAYDSIVDRPNNWVAQYMAENINPKTQDDPKLLPPSFLDGKNGNTFLIHNAFFMLPSHRPDTESEHDNTAYKPDVHQTDDGQLVTKIARNILTAGIQNSLSSEFVPLPPTAELVSDNDQEMRQKFAQMQSNGRQFMKDVYKYATQTAKQVRDNKRNLLKKSYTIG